MADSTAGLVLLSVAVAVLVVAIICTAIYLAKVLKPTTPPIPQEITDVAAEPFTDPKEVRYARVDAAALPPYVTRAIVSDQGPSLDLLHGFLTAAEATHLIRLAEGRFGTSTVVDPTTGKNVLDKNRTSKSVYLGRGEDAVVQRIERRAAMATGVPLAHFEQLQVVRYEPGQFYKAHHDYLDDKVPDLPTRGQRMVTIFVYLNDLPPEETGGGTKFHVLGKTIRPKLGTGALWYNMVRDPTTSQPVTDPTTLHSGEPLDKAVKYGLNVWARTKPQA